MVIRFALNCAQLICLFFLSAAAFAQNAPPILQAGDAAVAGFSGTVVIGSPPPPDPKRIDKTYINLDGPSLRVFGLGRMGGPPQGQLVAAPRSFTATAQQIGQVFSLALDDANPPNIYAAASSAYGLPIVVPDADGDGMPDRARRGAPNAAFMPGLFGPITVDGGPSSIWKIDGRTGAVTLFANVILGGVPNSGPALGGLAFDPVSHQLFVADRDTGMIHRFTLDGVERGRFDHGTQALSAAGLPPIAFDPRKRINIESPAFDSGNPGTWAYAPAARRVFGMAVNRGRLYYAVAAGLRIWSVSLLPDGSFGPDARVEVAVPRSAPASAEISEILFDGGDMLVAERGAPTGAYDYMALAEAGENLVLRFRPKLPDDPPSRDLWFPVPTEYAIGFPPNYRNDDGGIAIGYGYDQAGNINRAVCGGTLWSTGEQLRNARDPEIVRRLQPGGPLIVNGLQGNSTQLLRPLNEPPFETYFINYDDRFDDQQARGYLGDVVIWRLCGQAMLPPLQVPVVCPAGSFNIDGVCRFGLACPSGTEFSNGCCVYRDCPASYVRIRGKCVPPPMNCKGDETFADGHCEAPKCPAGLVLVKRKASSNGLPTVSGANAPFNALPTISGSNAALNGLPSGNSNGGQPNMCNNYCSCPEGTQLSNDGTCKPPVTSCSPGQGILINGVCCTRQEITNGTCGGQPQPPPSLTIIKDKPKSCQLLTTGKLVDALGGPFYLCKFKIKVTNNGTIPATGATFTDIPTAPARIVDFVPLDSSGMPDSNTPSWRCNDPVNVPLTCTRQPGFDIPAGEGVQVAVAVAVPVSANSDTAGNCAVIGDTPAPNLGQLTTLNPGSNPSFNPNSPAGQDLGNLTEGRKKVDCKTVQVGPSPGDTPPPPPTITVNCPPGAVVLNGQCYVPTCQGGDCPPPVISGCPGGLARNSDGNCPISSGCPGGVARNSDGNCPTTTGCTGSKLFNDGACRCPFGMTEDNSGKCVRSTSKTKKKPTHKTPRRPRTNSNSDNPGSSSPSPNIQIQIGPGFPSGGGRPSGGRPPGGNVPNRTKG